MAATKIQIAASSWCAIMVALLAAVQFSSPAHPPLFLFVVFILVWSFGAVMLHAAPRFGAVGTAAYGVLLGVDLLVMHGLNGLNALIAAGSFLGAGLALAFLWTLRRPNAA